MTEKTIKIQCIHGLGDHRNTTWTKEWEEALKTALPSGGSVKIEFDFVQYDDIFENTDLSPFEIAGAVWKLARSGLGAIGRRRRGVLSDISHRIRWTAGYVVAWVEDDGFQRQTRKRLLDAVREFKPDVLVAHSLGSMVSYNALSHSDAAAPGVANILKKMNFVSIGSQIGNPFVIRNLTSGRVQALPVKFWHHLFNRHDDVFTAQISLPTTDNFLQTLTPFDVDGVADHYAPGYLTNRNAIESVWRPLVEEAVSGPVRRSARPRRRKAKPAERNTRRALLVGINDYPNETDRLEGCVNDVFTMSSVLQNAGFEPSSIRTCLDDRATAQGILDRLEWLLDDPRPGDERVFYFSGHGAQIPEYGENYEPDRHMETLVPWDFDWSAETSITDDMIFSLYSQLPYDMRFIMIFDCCHAGGLHRSGAARIKGLNPPDDIRHRELRWDPKTRMWVQREFERLADKFSGSRAVEADYFGSDGASVRLGRASMLRGLSASQYRRAKKTTDGGIVGPYLPLIIQACQENEYSYEYRHGVTSHGAFTYSFSKLLEETPAITFEDLVKRTASLLEDLQYNQKPTILGPSNIRNATIPWSSN